MQSYIQFEILVLIGQLHVGFRSDKNSIGPANAISLQGLCPVEKRVFEVTGIYFNFGVRGSVSQV